MEMRALLNKYIGKEFIIYGAGSIGARVFSNLKNAGMNILGFIDMYSLETEYLGVPIFRCSKLKELKNIDNYVVVITVFSECEHVWIKEILEKYGIKHVICKMRQPITKKIYDMNLLYEQLTERNHYDRFCDVQGYDEYVEIDVINLFFKDNCGNDQLILMDEEYLPYFDFFEGRIDALGENHEKDIIKFKEAYSVYRIINDMWEKGIPHKFIPAIKYNFDNKKYYIQSMLEVALFCIAKNYSKIKCRVAKEDKCIYDIQKMKELKTYLFDNDITHLYTPIPISGYDYIPPKRECGGITRVRSLCGYFRKNNIIVNGLNILDAGSYIGYFSQLLSNMGAQVTSVERNKANARISELINDIGNYNITFINTSIESLSSDEQYEITLLLSVLYWHLYSDLGVSIIRKIDQITNRYLIWESGDEIEKEKDFIFKMTNFTKYTKISDTFGTGKLREFGIFEK